jgi:hypothetical protein
MRSPPVNPGISRLWHRKIKDDFKFRPWHKSLQHSEMIFGVLAVAKSRNGVLSGIGESDRYCPNAGIEIAI